MQLDILPTIEPGLYLSQSEHQIAIESHFGDALLRELQLSEIEGLGNLDIFFVVFTNRCGSTFLTEIMHQVGFGTPPQAELFNHDMVIPTSIKHDISSFTNYFMRIVNGWNKDQQVGFKISARQLFWLTTTGLLSHFKSVKIIQSKRQDTISQAISFYIARQTGQWHSLMKKKENCAPISYNRNDILRCLHSIHTGQQLIQYYADMHDIPSISINYEDTLKDPSHEISRLASFLDAPHTANVAVDLDAVNISQQRNEDNLRLLESFKKEFFSHRGNSYHT